MELIIKAASQSSRTPLREKDAAMGMVPYIHRGEAIPNRQERNTPTTPSFFCPRTSKHTVDTVFQKDRYQGPQCHTQHPIPENLLELNVKVIPQINRFPLQQFHRKSSPFSGFTFRYLVAIFWFPVDQTCASPAASGVFCAITPTRRWGR